MTTEVSKIGITDSVSDTLEKRAQRLFWVGLAAIGFLYIARLGPVDMHPAFGDDQSVYLTTARALAAGQGYRQINQPDTPPESLYPIGYPALLAAFLTVFAWNATTLLVLRGISVVSCLLFVYLAHSLLRRYFSVPLSAAGALLIGLSPPIVHISGMIFSDCPFMPLTVAAILFAKHLIDLSPEMPRRRCIELLIAAAICAGCGMLTRTIGFATIGGIGISLLLHRRWREAFGFGFLCAAIVAPYLIWSATKASGGTFSTYKSWAASEPLANVVIGNLHDIVTNSGPALVFPPFETNAVAGVLQKLHLLSLLRGGIGLLLLVSVLVGMLTLLRRRDIVAWCALLYIGVVVAVPWEPTRYLLPVLPPILIVAIVGMTTVISFLQARSPATSQAVPKFRWVVPILLAVLGLGAFATDLMRVRLVQTQGDWAGSDSASDWHEMLDGLDRLNKTAPPDAVVISSYASGVFLLTGHRTWNQTVDVSDPKKGIEIADFVAQTPKTTPLYIFATERRHYRYKTEFGIAPVEKYLHTHPGSLVLLWQNTKQDKRLYKVIRSTE